MHHKMEENFTLKAKKIWQAIPAEIRLKILNNVWCVQCKEITAGAQRRVHPLRRRSGQGN
jgi:hypothetical protein